ncbi:Rhodanese-like protein [Dirofilaria immitis]|nr:Rhodanese-like protein [Dirofilaria immitis]
MLVINNNCTIHPIASLFLGLESEKDDNFKTLPESIVPDVWNSNDRHYTGSTRSSSNTNVVKSKMDIDVMPSFLLTLLITKRKLCLFEAGTDRSEESKREYREEHIETARLLQFANLSVNGTPVHPLQFQRYIRSLGVDADCYVIIYDRGEVVWATHALWIFVLFGHQKVSLYSGGISEWKKLKENSAQYRTESGGATYPQRSGHFRAEWNSAVICTFDDVLINTELKTHDLVDGQNREQYEGISSGAIYGHIRSSINVPAEDVYDWHNQKWRDESDLKIQLRSKKLNENRPVIVYSSSAIHSSLTWFILRKCGYNSSIYFGSWPEWLIRAPEFLKIVPRK